MHWRLPVACYSAWPPERDRAAEPGGLPGAAAPDVGFVEPMLRRRLGRLAKMALRVAQDCAVDRPRLRLVYASRHGDLARSLGLLRELAGGEMLSPTAFGLSVHNAAAGIFSILRQDPSPATAIAAGIETFGMALIEAAAQLRTDPRLPVLLVYADEPVPADYAAFATPIEAPHALAVLFEADAPREIECRVTDDPAAPSAQPQTHAFLDSLRSGRMASWRSGHRAWSWH